jgi:hypothetical protein
MREGARGGGVARWAVVAALAAAAVGCTATNVGREAAFAEELIQLGDAVSALRQENAMLQEQLDSLQRAVARQDTVVRQIAAMAGVPAP